MWIHNTLIDGLLIIFMSLCEILLEFMHNIRIMKCLYNIRVIVLILGSLQVSRVMIWCKTDNWMLISVSLCMWIVLMMLIWSWCHKENLITLLTIFIASILLISLAFIVYWFTDQILLNLVSNAPISLSLDSPRQ